MLILKEMENNKEYIKQVYCYDDVIKNIEDNMMSALLTVEEGQLLKAISKS